MRKVLAVASVAAVAVALSACSGGGGGGGAGAGDTSSLTLAVITPPTSFDPAQMPLGGPEASYYEPVYDSLLNLDADGNEIPNLVTEWEYDETLTSLTLTLRDDVEFTDGTPFNADAVKANIEATKAGTGANAQAYRFVDGVEVVDDTTAVVQLSAPDPALEPNLARTPGFMVSPDALGTDTLATAPVGTGPYVLDESATTAGDTYVYTRNADYWNPDAYPFESVSLRYIDDTTALINAMRSGQVNGTAGGSAEAVTGAEQANLTITKYINGNVDGVYLWDRNGALAPALGDVRVRQAINFAMDRETILDTVKDGIGTITVQPFAPQTGAYDEALEDLYPYDLEKAQELMAEAGYADGFEMTLPDFSPVYPDEQAAMTEALAALNITINYEPVTGDQAVGNIIQGLYPMNFFTLSSSNPWDFAQLAIAPSGVFNPFHTDDPTVVQLLDDAQSSTGEAQDDALRELNQYVTEQAWFALWNFQEGAYITTDNVTVEPVQGANVPPLYQFAPAS